MAIATLIQRTRSLQRLKQQIRPSAVRRIEAGGLYDFIPALNRQFMPPRHLHPLVQALERSWSEPIRRTAHAPPRFAKTDTVLNFIVLTLLKQPWRTLAYVTYEDRTARSKSRRCRNWALSAGIELDEAAGNLNEWRTKQGGGLLATGIGGPLTSQGVDILLVDDPYKNRLQAESPAYRAMVADWWGDVAETRIEPGGSAFIFHTRWHNDDLIGHVLTGEDKDNWQHILMPAISEAGESLWPERWPLELLRQKERSVGAYTWASLFQGAPRPRGGAVFNDAHFYETPPASGYRIAIGVDLAYTKKTSSDHSVAVVLAATREKQPDGKFVDRFFVLEVVREQLRAPEFRAKLKVLKERYPGAIWRMYAAGTELGTVDLMADGAGGIPLLATSASADKFLRAQGVAAAWNNGRVLVRQGARWAEKFVTELTSFTGLNDPEDDQVDALAPAYDALAMTSGPMFSGQKMPGRSFN